MKRGGQHNSKRLATRSLAVLLVFAVSFLDPFGAFASLESEGGYRVAHYGKWHALDVRLGLREVRNCEVNVCDGLVCGLVSTFHHEPFDLATPFCRSRRLASTKLIQNFAMSQGVLGCRKRWHRSCGGCDPGIPGDCLIRDSLDNDQEGAIFFKVGEDSSGSCLFIETGESQRPVMFHLFFYRSPPGLRKSFSQSIRCTFAGQPGKLLSGNCKAVPQKGVSDFVPGTTPPGGSEYQFVAKCGDFAVSVGIGIGGGLATVSGDDNFILRPVGDNDRAIGFQLSRCTQTNPRKNESGDDGTFHLLILSTAASGGMVSSHGLETSGSRLFLSKDGYQWYEIDRSGE